MNRKSALILAVLLSLCGSALAQAHSEPAPGEHAAPAQSAPPQSAPPAHVNPPTHVTPPAHSETPEHAGEAVHAAAAEHGAADEHAAGADHDAPPSTAQIFLQLYKHLEPHAVAAVWFGGKPGFAFVPHFPTDVQGQPTALDAHHHPVGFSSTAELNAWGKAAYGGGFGVVIHNINTAQWIAAAIVLLVFLTVARGAKKRAHGVPTGGVYNMFESLVLFVRDEMVYKIMGAEHGRRFVPLFLTQFVFILAMNLLGLLWLGDFGGTATANLAVTGGLALSTLAWIVLAGVREHGVFGYFKTYAPHGLPLFVVPLIFVIELASNLVIKPAALTIRLFANMTAGHLVMLSLFGLVYLAGTMFVGVPTLLAMGFAVGICLLEVMVAFIQAYIFTYLSIVFVGASVHPEH